MGSGVKWFGGVTRGKGKGVRRKFWGKILAEGRGEKGKKAVGG